MMQMMMKTAKAELRKEVRGRLAAAAKNGESSERIAAATMAVLRERFSKNYSKPVRISVYLPMVGREVNTWPLVASLLSSDSPKFLVSVPKVIGDLSEDMRMVSVTSMQQCKKWPENRWGIPEISDEEFEASSNNLDVTDQRFDAVILPGMAFTAHCDRLGHGRGYYDCFLNSQRAACAHSGKGTPVTIGVAFDEQIFEEVPLDAHDQPLHCVITPSKSFHRSSTK